MRIVQGTSRAAAQILVLGSLLFFRICYDFMDILEVCSKISSRELALDSVSVSKASDLFKSLRSRSRSFNGARLSVASPGDWSTSLTIYKNDL